MEPRVAVFLAATLAAGESCEILKTPQFRTVGVAPNEADYAQGLAVVVNNKFGNEYDEKAKMIYTTVEEDRIPVDGFMLVDRNTPDDLFKQADFHARRPSYKSAHLVCVKSKCNSKLKTTVFLPLWYRKMHYVVVECDNGTHYVYDNFAEEVITLEEAKIETVVREFRRIWSNMRGTPIKVSAIQENLSFLGKTPQLGKGLDSSFLYEFSRHHNFTPIVLDGKYYKFSNLQVWSHQAEFGVNSRFIDSYDQKYLMSGVVYGDNICLIVRRKSYVRGWEVYQALFHKEVWLCLFVAIFLINTILRMVCRHRSWYQWLGISSRSMFTVPVLTVLRETKERMIIGSCLLFGLIFISYVQAMLYHILRQNPPVQYPPEDLVYKYAHVMRDSPFVGEYTSMRKKEYTLSINVGLIKPNDYAVKCPGYTRNMAYLMRYETPFAPHINRFVISAFEAGLPEAWFSITLMKRKKFISEQEKVKVLNMLDFEVAFFELFFGLTISLLVFIGEVVSSKIQYVG